MIKEALAATGPIKVDLGNVGNGVGVPGGTELSIILGNVIKIILAIAIIIFLFMLIFGAFEWIISGGDKEKVASARGRITHALIGLVILALAFVIVTIVGRLIGIDVFNLTIPTLISSPTVAPVGSI